jgi:Uma2 family endonuclease
MTLSDTTTLPRITPAEYLTREEQAAEKSEYEDGVIIPMPGGTPHHNQIMLNITTLVDVAIGEQDFVVCNSETRIRTPDAMNYYYPDLSVVAGEPLFDPGWETATLTNPCLVVEVLSRTTAQRDQGSKFERYKTIPTLREYLLVDQYRVQAVQWVRPPQDEMWHATTYTRLDEHIALQSVPVYLPLQRIYRRVTFAQPEEPQP